MLHMVLEDKTLQELYDYDANDYEDMYTAYNSNVVVVGAVARFIKDFNGVNDDSEFKKVYRTVFNYISAPSNMALYLSGVHSYVALFSFQRSSASRMIEMKEVHRSSRRLIYLNKLTGVCQALF